MTKEHLHCRGREKGTLNLIFGIFLSVIALIFTIYNSVVFCKMWGERNEFTRKKVAENQLKVPKNGLLPAEQRFFDKLLGKFSVSTVKHFKNEIRQKKTTELSKPVTVKKSSPGSNGHKSVEKPDVPRNQKVNTVPVGSKQKNLCRSRLREWGRRWNAIVRERDGGLPDRSEWEGKIFCPSGTECKLGNWKGYSAAPKIRRRVMVFYCPVHKLVYCADNRIRHYMERKNDSNDYK